jgi:hypothetical protein
MKGYEYTAGSCDKSELLGAVTLIVGLLVSEVLPNKFCNLIYKICDGYNLNIFYLGRKPLLTPYWGVRSHNQIIIFLISTLLGQ